MKKFLLIFIISILNVYALNSKIQASYAIGIFDEYKNGENIQHKRITQNDYNGTIYSKIIIFGTYSNSNIEIKLGNSIGYFEKSIPIYNNKKVKIGEEITFKHYNFTKGYFEIKINNKLYDTKVYVK